MSRRQKEENKITAFIPNAVNCYKKSNFIIQAAYKSSALTQKILHISSAFPQYMTVGKVGESIYSRIPVAELRSILGANRGSFYQQLNKSAIEMAGMYYGICSEDFHEFEYIAPIISAKCRDGVFQIEYNHAMYPYFYQLQRNYSKLALETMVKLNKPYTMRLYELLKSKCYRYNGDEREDFVFSYGFSELKLKLGVVDAQDMKVRKYLTGKKDPDYDKAVNEAQNRMFDTWYEFRRKVLECGVADINNISDLIVSYEPISKGVGGKVVAIQFTVKLKSNDASNMEPVCADILDDALRELGDGFRIKDVITITETAGNDLEKIKTAKKCLDQAGSVDNPVGFIISAIKNGYVPSTPTKHKKKDAWNDFEHQKYDFEELKKMNVANYF